MVKEKTPVQKMAAMLKKAPQKVQIRGAVAEIEDGKIVGYCAIGYLGCKQHIFDKIMGYRFSDSRKEDRISYMPYGLITKAYGFEEDYERLHCPICHYQQYGYNTLIPHLNDTHCLTFKQIAEVILEVEAMQKVKAP